MLKELLAKQLAHKVSKGLDVTEDLNRIDFLFFRGRLAEQEYDELLALLYICFRNLYVILLYRRILLVLRSYS